MTYATKSAEMLGSYFSNLFYLYLLVGIARSIKIMLSIILSIMILSTLILTGIARISARITIVN